MKCSTFSGGVGGEGGEGGEGGGGGYGARTRKSPCNGCAEYWNTSKDVSRHVSRLILNRTRYIIWSNGEAREPPNTLHTVLTVL